MNIKYNNIDSAQAHGLVTLSDVPAILEISDTTGGTKATLEITVGTGWTATANNECWLTFQNNTISNVTDPQNAVNKNFYIASDTHSTAVSIANALRNCPTVSASFLVYTNNDKVICKAREIGEIDLTTTMSENMKRVIKQYERDSIHTHDSVFVKSKADTIYINHWRTVYRDRVVRDTVFESRVDSVQNVVEVEKKLTKWQQTKMNLGLLLIGLIVVMGVVRYVKIK